jgi:hypothetical protein
LAPPNKKISLDDSIQSNDSTKSIKSTRSDDSTKLDESFKSDQSLKIDESCKTDESIKSDESIKTDKPVKCPDENGVDKTKSGDRFDQVESELEAMFAGTTGIYFLFSLKHLFYSS